MELRHLRYFIAVASDLNFSKASRRLHVAQPAISQTILDLEDELGVKLLIRTGRGVEGRKRLLRGSSGNNASC